MNEETVLEIFDRDIPFYEMDTQSNGIMYLIKMFPNKKYIISHADYEVIYFDVSVEELCDVASEEDIIFLRKCGFHLYEDTGDVLLLYI